MVRLRQAGIVLASLLLTGASVAHAQVVLSGQWRSGATAIDVQVESWGSDCGPAPKSSQSAGGGLVRIVQAGDRLSLYTGNRVIKSDVCFGQNPGLKRTSKSVQDNTWITRCETPDDDPRAETGVYTLKLLSEDRLLYQDVSRFRWQLKSSLCVATITTVQTLTRLTDAEAAKAAKSPESVAAPAPAKTAKAPPPAPALPKESAAPQQSVTAMLSGGQKVDATKPAPTATKAAKPPCVPGDPARLALAPRERRIELGGHFCFRTRLVDAAGCRLPPVAPAWTLDSDGSLKAKLDDRGCFEASTQAAEGEGTFRVTATVTTPNGGALKARAVVEVVTADLSALVAKRLFDDGPDAGELEAELAAQTGGPPELSDEPPPATASSHTATRAVGAAQAPVARPAWMWPAIAGVLALLGGAIALVARRRTRASMSPEVALPARDRNATGPAAVTSPKPSSTGELRCPKCGAIYPAGSAFCGTDGSPLKS